jgi:hypothetical protein
MCALEHDEYLASYVAESYLGATGRCVVHRTTVRGETWTVGDTLGPFPCDAARPAIYADPTTYLLTLLVPKGTEWGLAGATPGIVEYTSRDLGETWSEPTVHEVV